MKRITRHTWTAVALLSLGLAGCGGSDSVTLNEPQIPPGAFDEVPASAKASVPPSFPYTRADGLRPSASAH